MRAFRIKLEIAKGENHMREFPADRLANHKANHKADSLTHKTDSLTVVYASLLLTAAMFAIPYLLYTPRAKEAKAESSQTEGGTEQAAEKDQEAEEKQEAGIEAERETVAEQETGIEQRAGIEPAAEQNTDQAQGPNTAEDATEYAGERDGERVLKVLMHESGKVVKMDLGTYVTGVVRGEMPASFEPEALKAQAVAARTYTRYMLRTGKHGDTADICTDFNCCQAYVGEEQARKNWGKNAAEYEAKIVSAVSDTDGEILLYDGAPILAVFHASSAGLTRTAEDVWSGGQPYLRPVESPEDAAHIPNYYSRVEFSAKEFQSRIRAAYPAADFSGPMEQWITDVQRDGADSVITLRVGGVSMQGSKLRAALGLRSACFNWEIRDGKLIFYVTGFGHGVGLSQYGANTMAQNGADYREILTHYYTGVTLGGYVSGG